MSEIIEYEYVDNSIYGVPPTENEDVQLFRLEANNITDADGNVVGRFEANDIIMTSIGTEQLKFTTISVITSNNPNVSPFSCWGRTQFNLGDVKTLRVTSPDNTSLAVAYKDRGYTEYINVVSNKTGTYDVVVGYI